MELQLAERWWMGGMVTVTGIVLLVLNARALSFEGRWAISTLSTASAAFLTALGMALILEPEENV